MTPTAQWIANETCKPVRERRLFDPMGMVKQWPEIHCFDLCAVSELAVDIGYAAGTRGQFHERLAFLPAPWTFIDLVTKKRHGYLLHEIRTGVMRVWDVQVPWGDETRMAIIMPVGDIALLGKRGADSSDGGFGTAHFPEELQAAFAKFPGGFNSEKHEGVVGTAASFLVGSLALINTPRIIGRTQHMPHAGLQRKLARARGMVGKFPLHAWTTIKLEVIPPKMHDGAAEEGRLSGTKALHFCRTHLRFRLGQLELVTAHWRGDPALGMKQSRYEVVPPRQGRAA